MRFVPVVVVSAVFLVNHCVGSYVVAVHCCSCNGCVVVVVAVEKAVVAVESSSRSRRCSQSRSSSTVEVEVFV